MSLFITFKQAGPGAGGGGPNCQLVNSPQRVLSRGPGFDPGTKGERPWGRGHQCCQGQHGEPQGSLPLLCRYLCNNGVHSLFFISVTVLGTSKEGERKKKLA